VSAPAWPWLAAFGLLVGFGVRSAVWRLAVEVPPRTGCPRCGIGSRWLLVPVQPLTGRCTRCAARTGPPILMPELLGAVGFGLAGWIGGGPLRIAALCWLAAFGLSAVLVDAVVQRLPDVLTFPCLAGVLALCCGQAAVSGSLATAVRTVLAGAAVAGFFLVLALVADVGLGDVKFAACLGAVLGYISWNTAAAGIAAGFCLAGLYATVALAARRTQVSARLALGPPLMAGAFLVLVLAA
jgi:leader peptidase (prepilin peptidase) / N-methyltransferase